MARRRLAPADALRAATGGQTEIRRVREGRMIGGVAAGLAERFGVDPLLVRIVFVCAAIWGGGLGLVAYLALWAFLPEYRIDDVLAERLERGEITAEDYRQILADVEYR